MQRFRVLDSWRGIAALCVALFHFPSGGMIPTIPFVNHAWLFVDFFFVLSGFVIAHAYADRITDGTSFWVFFIRRLGRLWPLHIATLLPLVALELAKWASVQTGLFDANAMGTPPFTGAYSLHDLASNLVFGQAFMATFNPFLENFKFIGGWNGPSWTISIELWVSIMFATACLTAPKRLIPLAFLAIVGTIIWLCTVGPGNLSVGVDFGVARALLGFATGYLVYRLYKTQRFPLTGTLAEIAAVIAMVIIISVAGTGWLTFVAVPIFAFAVYVFAHERGALSKVLNDERVAKLGDWSFSIYLTHFVILQYILAAAQVATKAGFPMFTDGPGPGVFVVSKALYIGNGWITDLSAFLYLAIVVIVSSFTYKWIEDPARNYVNAWSSRWAARQRERAAARATANAARP